jgi:phenylacetate-CoA ligase
LPDQLSIYHRLPYPLRVAAASVWGYYLRSWRYGPETERLVNEALERETWSAGQWKNWQEERLAFILHRAATQVPYYRRYWQERRKRGDRSSWEVLSSWPILDKETLRTQTSAFVVEDCDIKKMYAEHTSGTTGTPLHIWFSRSAIHQWYAIFEARIRRWYDVSYKVPWGIFGGQVVTPFDQKKPPYWVRNLSLNQTYFSVLHIAPWTFQTYIEEIKKRQITHLIVYTNSLYLLACEVPRQMQPVKSNLKAIFTNAEPLFDFQRRKLEQVFDCPVVETYGLAEMNCAASGCKHGKMHWWPEVGVPEVVNDEGERIIKPGETGRLIATGLLNPDMPLIRYDTKDLTTLPSADDSCECERSLPLAGKFVGRYDDVILTRDGRRLTQLDTIFDPHLPIKEAQIVQNTLDDFTIRVVVDEGWMQKDADYLTAELQKRVGQVNVSIKEEKLIEKTWVGKFRIIVSKLKH